MKRLIALIFGVLTLSGCVPHTELDRLGIAEAVGVDYENGIYTVTVQYFNTDASGGVTAVDSTAPNVTVADGRGRTIESALEALSYTTGRDMMIGAASVIVFGESALFSLEDALSLAASHYSGDMSAYIVAARGKAADVMNVRFKEGSASVEKLCDMLRNTEELGLTRRVKMYEVMEKLCGGTKSAVLPLLQAYPDDTGLSEDGTGIIIAGGALVTGGRLADELPVREMSGLAMLDPSPASRGTFEMTVSYMGADTRVLLYGVKPRITPELTDGRLGIEVELTADCKIVSTALSEPYRSRGDLARICADEAAARVREFIESSYTAFGADPAGLGYIVRAASPEIWNSIEPDLRNQLREAQFPVSAKVRMERFGVVR